VQQSIPESMRYGIYVCDCMFFVYVLKLPNSDSQTKHQTHAFFVSDSRLFKQASEIHAETVHQLLADAVSGDL